MLNKYAVFLSMAACLWFSATAINAAVPHSTTMANSKPTTSGEKEWFKVAQKYFNPIHNNPEKDRNLEDSCPWYRKKSEEWFGKNWSRNKSNLEAANEANAMVKAMGIAAIVPFPNKWLGSSTGSNPLPEIWSRYMRAYKQYSSWHCQSGWSKWFKSSHQKCERRARDIVFKLDECVRLSGNAR